MTVGIGPQPAQVDFAGEVGAGLVQINVQVPAGLDNGDAVVGITFGYRPLPPAANLIPVHN